MTKTAQELRQEFKNLQDALLARHIERYDEIEIGLAAILSGGHVVLVGPPGTAKSMLAEDLCSAFEGANYFSHLMNKFSVPEELFGPVNIAALETGQYERVIEGMIPEAHIAFLDEVFKSNSAILNMLLQLMNERKYKHGSEILNVPLITMFAASNELPEGEELGALFDRFQFRKKVDYIQEPANFVKMLTASDTVAIPTLTLEDLTQAQAYIAQVQVPPSVIDTMYEVRADLYMEGIIPSDRRFNQSQKALRAMAWLAGRDIVNDDDFRILQHMLWTQPMEAKKVSRVILTRTNPLDFEAEEIIDVIDTISGELTAALLDCQQKGQDPKEVLLKKGIEWFGKIKSISTDLKKLENKANSQNKPLNRIHQAKERAQRVAREINRQTIGYDQED